MTAERSDSKEPVLASLTQTSTDKSFDSDTFKSFLPKGRLNSKWTAMEKRTAQYGNSVGQSATMLVVWIINVGTGKAQLNPL